MTPTPPFLRLLSQERETLLALDDLAKRQEDALVAGETTTILELAAQKTALLQRESRLSLTLASLAQNAGGARHLLAKLPSEHQSAGQALVAEVTQLITDLKRRAARLAILSEAGLNRIAFVYQTIARTQQGPGPYSLPGRRPVAGGSTMLSRRV